MSCESHWLIVGGAVLWGLTLAAVTLVLAAVYGGLERRQAGARRRLAAFEPEWPQNGQA